MAHSAPNTFLTRWSMIYNKNIGLINIAIFVRAWQSKWIKYYLVFLYARKYIYEVLSSTVLWIKLHLFCCLFLYQITDPPCSGHPSRTCKTENKIQIIRKKKPLNIFGLDKVCKKEWKRMYTILKDSSMTYVVTVDNSKHVYIIFVIFLLI